MSADKGRVLAVDPGEKNIGLAISDETATLARPLTVVRHVSKLLDAATIASIALENQAVKILVGMPTGPNGEDIAQTRHARSLAQAIQSQSSLPVILWDEYGTTNAAQTTLLELGVARERRGGHQDALAASLILKSYLESSGEFNGE